jgi:hypothetical protein
MSAGRRVLASRARLFTRSTFLWIVFFGLLPVDAAALQPVSVATFPRATVLLLLEAAEAPRAGVPDPRVGRIGGQLAAGAGSELVGFFVGAPVGAGIGLVLARITPIESRSGLIRGAFLGSLVGLAAGAATGVYLVGSHGDETASYLATLGGATAGTALGLTLSRLDDSGIGSLLRPFRPILSLPPIGATLGFVATRKYR